MDDASSSKRRRGLGVVTPNACTECRKKRAKCDGRNPCGRCAAQKGSDCVYEVPVRQSKEHMRTEIEKLRAQQRQSERVLSALVSNEQAEQVLEHLRSGQTLETVSEYLDKGMKRNVESGSGIPEAGSGDNVTTYDRPSEFRAVGNVLKTARSVASSPLSSLAVSDTHGDSGPLPDPGSWPSWTRTDGSGSNQASNQSQNDELMQWSPEAPPSQHGFPLIGTWHQQLKAGETPDTTTQFLRNTGAESILGYGLNYEEYQHHKYTNSWTNVTGDGALVEHLMALYFCWEYPTFASLSKEHFLEDYRSGRLRYCSPLLVNAILAVGCRFSTQAGTQTDPNNSNTAGDHFFAEALKLLQLEVDRHSLTTVQALGLMSIREASRGRSSEGIYYSGQSIRLAIEMGLHKESESGGGDTASLGHAVRSATFWGAFALDQCWSLCVGRLPHFSHDIDLIAKPSIVDHIEASPWIPYTDDGGAPQHRLGTQPSNVRSVYKTFCELSEIVHKTHYLFYTPGGKLTARSLLHMYTTYLKWYDTIPVALRLGQNFTPVVLFAHMYYHFAILLLFRPFIKLDIVGSGVSPRDVCSQAADAIMTLVKSYAELYTLQRTPSFVPYLVMAASIAHLVTLGTGRGGPEKLQQGIEDLKTMACHGSASRARDILRFLAYHWKVDVKIDGADKRDPALICRPRTTSFNQFCPNMDSVYFESSIQLTQSLEENPLFWPFPIQGRPLLGIGNELTRAGFRLATSKN